MPACALTPATLDRLQVEGATATASQRAPSNSSAEATPAEFGQEWDGRFPSISRSGWERWETVTPFYACPPEICKVIYTTSAVESISATIRKVTKKRGAFPTPDSVRKVVYLAIRTASARWSRPVKDWAAALNHFAIVFEGRVPR